MDKINFLKKFRKSRNITQKELSKNLDYSLATIKSYEKKEKLPMKFVDKLNYIYKLTNEEKKELNFEPLTQEMELNFYKKLEEIKLKEEYLNKLEQKLKREEIKLKKEKLLTYLEENKSDYLKIKEVLINLKSIIGELDVKTSLSFDLKNITKNEIINILNRDIQELEKIKKRFSTDLMEEIIYEFK